MGPTWLGLFGSERRLEDGTTVLADEDYLRESILDPGKQIVAGYPNVMPGGLFVPVRRRDWRDHRVYQESERIECHAVVRIRSDEGGHL